MKHQSTLIKKNEIRKCIDKLTHLRNSHQILGVHFGQTQLGDGQMERADADARNVLWLDLHFCEETIN